MPRRPLVAFVLVLLVAAVPAASYLTKKREVIASTPSAYTGLTIPLPLPGKGEACVDEIVYDQDSAVARFGATAAPGQTAPALEVIARGNTSGPYRNDYRAQARVPGGWQGTRTLDVPLTPAPGSGYGTLCIRNLEDKPVDLVGSADGRAFSRPSVKVNGQPTPTELQLRFMERGEHRYISRLGEITTHASTLKPLGAWWFWVLALALLTVVPLGALAAMRAAFADDAALLARPAEPWPSERLRERLARIPGWAIVAAAGAVAFVWFVYWGWNTHVFQSDENQYVSLSRWLWTDFPASLVNFDVYGRGLQRLEVWLLAIPAGLLDSPWSLAGGRVLNTIAFVSTAIPVYRLGRELQLRPHWAALPAVISIVVPWAVVTTGFLTENVAYPASMWAIWAIWRASVEPGWHRDLLALVLLVVAGAARSGMLLLVPVLPIVAAGTTWRCGLPWRRHWLLGLTVGAGVLVLLADGLGLPGADGVGQRLAGGYTTKLDFELSDQIKHFGDYISKVVLGTGFFPAAIGMPWVAVQLFKSREPGRFAFALLVLVTGAALLYSLNTAGPDERYVLYFAPLVLLPATLALAFRELTPLGVTLGSIVMAGIVASMGWTPEKGQFGFFVEPVEMFYSRVIGLKLASHLPGDEGVWVVLAAVALGVLGLALAAVLRWRPRRLNTGTAFVLGTVVVATVLIQTQYTFDKYVNGAGSRSAPSIRQRAFVDRTVPKGATVGQFDEGAGKTAEYLPLWQELQFYNQRVDTIFSLGRGEVVVPPGDGFADEVSFDPATGRLRSPKHALPDYLVIPGVVGEARIRGEVVANPGYLAVALVKVAQPPTLSWSARGFGSYGAMGPEGARVRFYGTGLPAGSAQCAAITYVSPGPPAQWRMTIDGDPVSAGTVQPGAPHEAKVPLRKLTEKGYIDARITGTASVAGITVIPGC
jgi:hypothetical protein